MKKLAYALMYYMHLIYFIWSLKQVDYLNLTSISSELDIIVHASDATPRPLIVDIMEIGKVIFDSIKFISVCPFVECQNGGRLDRTTCQCDCPPKYYGFFCQNSKYLMLHVLSVRAPVIVTGLFPQFLNLNKF